MSDDTDSHEDGHAALDDILDQCFVPTLTELDLTLYRDSLYHSLEFTESLQYFIHLRVLKLELLGLPVVAVPNLDLYHLSSLHTIDIKPWLAVSGAGRTELPLGNALTCLGRLHPHDWYDVSHPEPRMSLVGMPALWTHKLPPQPLSIQFYCKPNVDASDTHRFNDLVLGIIASDIDRNITGWRRVVANRLEFDCHHTLNSLAPLVGVRLTALTVMHLPLGCVSSLSLLTTLNTLDITGCQLRGKRWQELTALTALPLTELHLTNCHLTQVQSLTSLRGLRLLFIKGNPRITSLTVLRHIKTLSTVVCAPPLRQDMVAHRRYWPLLKF
jgi:hypothetical protein